MYYEGFVKIWERAGKVLEVVNYILAVYKITNI